MMAVQSPIRVRLTFWYTLVLGLILVGTGSGVYLLLARSLHARTDLGLLESAAAFRTLLAHEAEEEPEWTALQVVQGTTAEGAALGWRIAVYNDKGEPVSSSASEMREQMERALARKTNQERNEVLLSGNGARFATVEGENRLRVFATPIEVNGQRFTVTFFRATRQEHEVLEQLLSTFMVLMPVVLILAGVAGYFLARRALAPIARMAREAEQIGATNLQNRLRISNPHDELGSLASVFNELLARLENAFRQQRRFMADASHELRTPTAIIRGEAEVSLSRPDRTPHDYRESLEIVVGEAERLTRLVDDLFTLARADTGQTQLIRSNLYLDELVNECCRSFRSLARERSVRLTCNAQLEAPLEADSALLRRLILNLLENATRHTPPGGSVQVCLHDAGGSYLLSVSDTGTGVPPTSASNIFDRFYRADPARSRDSTDGAGLGLPIARLIAEAHGGTINLARTSSEGTTFVVSLPNPMPNVDHVTAPAV